MKFLVFRAIENLEIQSKINIILFCLSILMEPDHPKYHDSWIHERLEENLPVLC